MQVKYKTVINFSVVIVADEPIHIGSDALVKAFQVLPAESVVHGQSFSRTVEMFETLGMGPEVQRVEPADQAIAETAPDAPQKKARKPKVEKPVAAAAEPAQQPEKNPNFKQFTGDDVRNALRAALAAGVDSDDVNQLLIKRGYDNISAIGENQKVFANIIEEANKLIARNS